MLHSVIDGLHWNGQSRNGVEPFRALNQWTTFSGGGPAGGAPLPDPNDFTSIEQLRSSMSAAGTLGALNLVVRGTRDLPGRKAVILVSEGFELLDNTDNRIPESRVRMALDRLVDQATRAGVVIYSLDARGLQTGGLLASDNLKSPPPDGTTMDAAVRGRAADRTAFNRDTQEGMAYLAEQTGGFAVLNTNDLSRGLGRITDDVRDYYVIGYSPSEGTFAKPGEKPAIHKISIRVKQPGLRVKTRKEFIGLSDPPDVTGPTTPAQQLIHAATSPFAVTDIALHATTLPGYSPERGTFVRALLHIDARPLTFVDTEGGKRTASVDVLGMVFDEDGTEVAHLTTGFSMGLTSEAAGGRRGRRHRLHAADTDPSRRRLPGPICGARSALGPHWFCRRIRRGRRHGPGRLRALRNRSSQRRLAGLGAIEGARRHQCDAGPGACRLSARDAPLVCVRDLQRRHARPGCHHYLARK